MRRAPFALALVACGSASAPSTPVVVHPAGPDEALPVVVAPPPPGWLTFVSEDSGQVQVHAARTDGSDRRIVAGCPELAFPGPPDPKGEGVLLVCSNRHEDARHVEQLVWVPWSGGAPVPLSGPAGRARSPAWAADGSFLVFESDHLSFRDLYRVPRGGGEIVRLTDHRHGQFEPAPSPDGSRLAFVSSRDMNAEIYVSDALGRAPTRRTDHPRDDGQPAWSPDGSRLAFVSARTGEQRLWWMGADGAGASPVIPGMGSEHLHFVWSPDGSRIAVVSRDHGSTGSQILVVAVDGPRIAARLGDAEARNEHPVWSPDGGWLAWDRQAAGSDDVDVWVGRADGREPRAVTTGGPQEWLPRWHRLPP